MIDFYHIVGVIIPPKNWSFIDVTDDKVLFLLDTS